MCLEYLLYIYKITIYAYLFSSVFIQYIYYVRTKLSSDNHAWSAPMRQPKHLRCYVITMSIVCHFHDHEALMLLLFWFKFCLSSTQSFHFFVKQFGSKWSISAILNTYMWMSHNYFRLIPLSTEKDKNMGTFSELWRA